MKIGIFGGTFDPLHNQHVSFILGAKDFLGLDKILLVPTYNPPHKKSTSTAYSDRLAMICEFAEGYDFIEVDESERECGSSYACDVVKYISKKHEGAELYYLMGGDSLMRLDAWRNPGKILEYAKIRVAGRGDRTDITELCSRLSAKYGGDIRYMFDCKEESSSTIRLNAILGRYERVGTAVPPCVCKYIMSHELYSEYRQAVAHLRDTISTSRFEHTLGVTEYAVEHAWQIWESFDNAFFAGLLHDCGKGRESEIDYVYPDGTAFDVKHQYISTLIAKEEFGVTNEVVLDAIRYHTTAKPEMSALGKLIYIADKVEKGRSYDGVDDLRRIAASDFEAGFKATLRHGYDFLLSKNCAPDVLTLRACAWYNIDTKH